MHHHTQPDPPMAIESFPTDPSGLPEAGRPQLLELAHGDTLDLRVGPVAKRLGDSAVRMLGYNGSIPGPTLKVQQGSEIIGVQRFSGGSSGGNDAVGVACCVHPLLLLG
jgi:hypothetical protein